MSVVDVLYQQSMRQTPVLRQWLVKNVSVQ